MRTRFSAALSFQAISLFGGMLLICMKSCRLSPRFGRRLEYLVLQTHAAAAVYLEGLVILTRDSFHFFSSNFILSASRLWDKSNWE